MKLKHHFIAIEGNIGTGKTTICKMLAKDWNCKLILEQFSENPFLPLFYEDAERHAFSVELFFMTERHQQLQDALNQPDLFSPSIIADYYFIKTLLFAGQNLKENELILFKRLFHVLNTTFSKPDLLVYLHRPVEVLLQNIEKRGRSYEKHITADYLISIQNAYFNYFKMEQTISVLILDIEDMNFVDNEKNYNLIQNAMNQNYKNQLTRIRL